MSLFSLLPPLQVTYPLDVVRTRIQTQSLTTPIYRGTMDCIQQVMRREGWRALWRGFLPTVLQVSYIVHSHD